MKIESSVNIVFDDMQYHDIHSKMYEGWQWLFDEKGSSVKVIPLFSLILLIYNNTSFYAILSKDDWYFKIIFSCTLLVIYLKIFVPKCLMEDGYVFV